MKSNDKKWITDNPELGTEPVPIEPYVSPEYFLLERENIFKCSWLHVGRINEIPHPGDYFVKDIALLKSSVIVVRGKDGVVRGFHNVCKHRGNKVVKDCAGSARRFACGFHNWTYDLNGRLASVPGEAQFYDLDKSEYGLTPVATDVWEGFIFINMALNPPESLREAMGELFDQFSGYPFDALSPVASFSAVVNVNWKVFMDSMQEFYHVPFLHHRSVLDSVTGKGNPLCHLISIRLHERHHALSVYANPQYEPTPAEALALRNGKGTTPTVLRETAATDALPPGINPTRSPNWAFDEIIIFPNFMLNPGRGSYTTDTYWPIAVDRTLLEVTLYLSLAKTPAERISQEFHKVLIPDLLREDLSTLENVQMGLASGALTHMPFSDQEITLRHSHKVVEDFLGTGNRSHVNGKNVESGVKF